MKFTAVKSSNIVAVAYEPGVMLVKFTGGAVYRYLGVPPEAHAALLRAESLGAHLARNVKGKYQTDRLSPEQVEAALSAPGADAPAVETP